MERERVLGSWDREMDWMGRKRNIGHACSPRIESLGTLKSWVSGDQRRAMSGESGHSIVPGQHFRSSGKMNEWTDGVTGRKDGCRQQAGTASSSTGQHIFVHRPSASR